MLTEKITKNVFIKLLILTVFVLGMLSPGTASAHHESCLSLQNPDRIVECSQQALRTAYSRCDDQHSSDGVARQQCRDDAARHQGIDPNSSNATPPPARRTTTGQSDVDRLLATGINILTGIAGLAIVGSIIAGGIQYSSAGGNASQVSAAKNRIVVSIASLLLLGFGYAILQWLVPGGIFN